MKNIILIKGAGDIATGVALRLHNSGYKVVMTELGKPTAIRRTVSFAEAVYTQSTVIENVKAVKCTQEDIETLHTKKVIPLLVNLPNREIEEIQPKAVVDAIIGKSNTGTYKNERYYTIALGPGFTAPDDVDVVIETMRGHYLGRCIYNGSAFPNTGIPGEVGGYTTKRVLRAKFDGVIIFTKQIGDYVEQKDQIGVLITKNNVSKPILAPISGTIRGALQNNLNVVKGFKIADIDPRCAQNHCFTASDKALAIGGGVLEALLHKKILPI